jgi:hypothetical protein
LGSFAAAGRSRFERRRVVHVFLMCSRTAAIRSGAGSACAACGTRVAAACEKAGGGDAGARRQRRATERRGGLIGSTLPGSGSYDVDAVRSNVSRTGSEARVILCTLRHFEALRPSRIGHGVRSVEDPDLPAELVARGIHLEVCPSCNVQTGICERLDDHPVDRLRRMGVGVGINTDAPTVTGVTLSEEYRRLHRAFGRGSREFRRCNLDALAAAFLDDAGRATLARRLEAGYAALEDAGASARASGSAGDRGELDHPTH